MALPQTGTNTRRDWALAVVIGAGGMGMAAARRLGERHRILLVDIDGDRLSHRISALSEEGCDASSFVCDITDRQSVRALADAVAASGPFRALAHVAGLSPSTADWQTIMRVNLIGASLVEEALLPFATAGTAAIFISSLAGHLGKPTEEVLHVLDEPLAAGFVDALERLYPGGITTALSYQLSKIALMRLCRRHASAWGQRGARIVSLSPGLIATPMGAREYQNPQKYELLVKTPLRREGTMLEIADAIDFLASDRASFVTGTDLLVDGGVAAALNG